MKTYLLLATSLVAFGTACGTSGVVAPNDASVVADATKADAGAADADAGVADADASVADASTVSPVSISAGYRHTCALFDNSVKCWGDNFYGQLGLGDRNARGDSGNEMGDKLPKVDLGTGRTAKAISAGGYRTCAILDDDSVKCWGYNGGGELGLGDTANRGGAANEMGDKLPKVDLGTGRTAKAISLSVHHACAILDDDSVKCWGYNAYGQLGLGDKNVRGDEANEMGDKLPKVDLGTGRTAKAISAGGAHTCAILDDNSVKCWGANAEGELGLGDLNVRGDNANEMGDKLPKVDLGTGRTAKALSSRGYHTCAILDDNSVKCWGFNERGQLGVGDTNDRGGALNKMGDNLPKVSLGTGRTAKAISAGYDHTCAVLDDDSVKCWGENLSGELGLGDMHDRGGAANEMGDNLPKVSLGTGRTVKAISAEHLHTCVVLDDDSVKCWGENLFGALGLGDTTNRGVNGNEMGDSLLKADLGTGRTAKAIASSGHTCVVLDDDSVKCWGENFYGQLGLGDKNARGDNANEMGDNLPKVDLGTK